MHMKDYVDVDVSNQENVAPVYFAVTQFRLSVHGAFWIMRCYKM